MAFTACALPCSNHTEAKDAFSSMTHWRKISPEGLANTVITKSKVPQMSVSFIVLSVIPIWIHIWSDKAYKSYSIVLFFWLCRIFLWCRCRRKGYIISELVFLSQPCFSIFFCAIQYNIYAITELIMTVQDCHRVILKDSKDSDASSRTLVTGSYIIRYFPIFIFCFIHHLFED